MLDFFKGIFTFWDSKVIIMILEGIRDTLYMTLGSTIVGYLLGLPLGIVLYVTSAKGLRPNPFIYRTGDFICNIIRSIPFLICNYRSACHLRRAIHCKSCRSIVK